MPTFEDLSEFDECFGDDNARIENHLVFRTGW
jgi:hypothetical protein